MLRDDFVIQSNVRRILIRSNIDYSQITFGTVKGVVYIQGTFRLAGHYSEMNPEHVQEFMRKTLRSLESNIKSIPEVVDVNFQLNNWKREKGQWRPKKVSED